MITKRETANDVQERIFVIEALYKEARLNGDWDSLDLIGLYLSCAYEDLEKLTQSATN